MRVVVFSRVFLLHLGFQIRGLDPLHKVRVSTVMRPIIPNPRQEEDACRLGQQNAPAI